jgi:hypothetical protein
MSTGSLVPRPMTRQYIMVEGVGEQSTHLWMARKLTQTVRMGPARNISFKDTSQSTSSRQAHFPQFPPPPSGPLNYEYINRLIH